MYVATIPFYMYCIKTVDFKTICNDDILKRTLY